MAMLAALAGIALQLQEQTAQPAWLYAVLTAAGILLLIAGFAWRHRVAVALVASVAAALVAGAGAALAGFGVAGGQAALRLQEALVPALEGRDLVVTGVVASLPQAGPNGLRFRFALDAASRRQAEATLPELLAVGWYGAFHEDAALSPPQRELKAGQRWRFTLRLRRPHGNLNPHGWDYELQLFEQGVRATGYVRDAPPAELLGETRAHPVERLRQRVRDAIYAAVPERRAAGVLAALAVGDQGAIERDDWERFRNTGVAHLMSIKIP